mmetsp:Transcript_45332/g.81050  ORF Transcript_45332/g.81050 Transcript_45332/m.81050 type:complete len:202 (-) Transcript_45332:1539-2144(-)
MVRFSCSWDMAVFQPPIRKSDEKPSNCSRCMGAVVSGAQANLRSSVSASSWSLSSGGTWPNSWALWPTTVFAKGVNEGLLSSHDAKDVCGVRSWSSTSTPAKSGNAVSGLSCRGHILRSALKSFSIRNPPPRTGELAVWRSTEPSVRLCKSSSTMALHRDRNVSVFSHFSATICRQSTIMGLNSSFELMNRNAIRRQTKRL